MPPELRIQPEPIAVDQNPEKFLKLTPLTLIPQSIALILLYIAFFAFAETAFIFMAVKEYIQDLLGLRDSTLLIGDEFAAHKELSQTLGYHQPKSKNENNFNQSP